MALRLIGKIQTDLVKATGRLNHWLGNSRLPETEDRRDDEQPKVGETSSRPHF